MKKEWSDADVESAWERTRGMTPRSATATRAIMTRAVELYEAEIRERGGTLEELAPVFRSYPWARDVVISRIGALGARVADLEAELAEMVGFRNELGNDRDNWERNAGERVTFALAEVKKREAAEEERAAALARVAALEAQVASERKHADRKQAQFGMAYEALTVAEQQAYPSDASLIARDAHQDGVEAMRAACWEAVQTRCEAEGFDDGGHFMRSLKAAIEGATP